MRYRIVSAVLLAGLFLFTGASVLAAQPQAFVSGSYAQLLARQGDNAFVLSVWSLDCPPCYRELAVWGEQQRTGMPLPLVLLSSDALTDAAEIDTVLAQNGLDAAESWVFAAPAQQLRYEIDRHWHGELPRTYLIVGGVVVDAVTGVLDQPRLEAWFKAAKKSRPETARHGAKFKEALNSAGQ